MIRSRGLICVNRRTEAELSKWASNIANTNRGVNAESMEKILCIQHDLIFHQNIAIGEIVFAGAADTLVTRLWGLLPFSRGSVHLRSLGTPDVDSPIIDSNFFSINFDMQCSIAVGRIAQAFWTKEPAKDMMLAFVKPDEETLPLSATDAQWKSFTRETCMCVRKDLQTGC